MLLSNDETGIGLGNSWAPGHKRSKTRKKGNLYSDRLNKIEKTKCGNWDSRRRQKDISTTCSGRRLRRFPLRARLSDNGLVETEAIVQVVFVLQPAQSVQAPWLVTVDRLNCFVRLTRCVVDIRLRSLAPIPEFPCFFGPCLSRLICRGIERPSNKSCKRVDPSSCQQCEPGELSGSITCG